MCDDMWDDNTEDIFQSVTIKQALRTPSDTWGRMSKGMRAWAAEALIQSSNMLEAFGKYKYMPKSKSKTIKFRRYTTNGNDEETLVRGFICEAVTTLGDRREKWSIRPCDLSGLGDSSLEPIEEI